MRFPEAEAAAETGAAPVILCTVALPDGRVLRHSTRPVEVEASTGGPWQYLGTLADVDEWVEEIDPWDLGGVGALSQARVSIASVATLAADHGAWRAITAATVELAVLWEGQRWERREVFFAGAVQSMEMEQPGRALVLSLEASAPVTSASVGDDTRDLGTLTASQVDTSGDAVTDLTGSKHILVLGAPRSVPAYKIGTGGGVTNRVVLCGHKLPDLSGVTVYDDGVSTGTHTPANVLTGLDNPYASVSHATEFTASDGALTWSAAWGGIRRADALGTPTRSAGDVLRYLLAESGVEVDWPRMARALRLLSTWPVGLWLDEEVPALDVIREHLLPWLPLVEMSSGSGLWYAYVDPWDGPPEFALSLGQHLVGHDGPAVTSDIDAIRNSFVMHYYRDEFSDEYTETVTLDATTDARCALSAQLYGTRAEDTLECAVVWDAVTARRILRARAARVALPRRRLRYWLAPDAYPVGVGSIVAVTDTTHGLDGSRGIVVGRPRGRLPVLTIDVVDRTPAGSW